MSLYRNFTPVERTESLRRTLATSANWSESARDNANAGFYTADGMQPASD